MAIATRTRNPLINSAKGGRLLSAAQLPFFLLRPPRGFGVLTTTGRKTGKRRRRCVRAIRRGDRVYLLAIKGPRTAWLRNAEASPHVELRIRDGRFRGVARRAIDADAVTEVTDVYCSAVNPFDYLECMLWVRGRPTRRKVERLHRSWCEEGAPLIIDLAGAGAQDGARAAPRPGLLSEAA